MSELAVPIASIYEPQIWEKYFLELTTEKSELINSGIAAATPEVVAAANNGGPTVFMPYWEDLAHNVPSDTTSVSKVASNTNDLIVPAGMAAKQDIAVKDFRTQSWQTGGVIKYMAGSDPAQQVISRYAYWWVREEQRMLLLKLKGIFANAGIAANLSKDISIADGSAATVSNLISTDAIESTVSLLGDAYKKFTAIAMHSVPFFRLRKLNLIDDVPDSSQGNTLETNAQGMPPVISYFQGKRVLVDDSLTVDVAGGGFKYHTFLFGQGAFARVDIPLTDGDLNLEYWIDPRAGYGAGSKDIITRRYMILHPRGIPFNSALGGIPSPSDTAFSTSTNWTQAYLTKNIRIAQLITNG